MPLFSVIIPVYNRAALVERTLESVFAQEFTDYEIVAVDDGSTDDSLATLRRHADRVRVISQENKGLGASRNAAAHESRGTYLAFLDSDDLWFPWTLSAVAEGIKRFNHPAFLCGNFVEFSDDAALAAPDRSDPLFTQFPCFLDSRGEGFSWCPSAAVVRADVFKQAGGFAEIRFNCEDQDFWLRIGTAPGFVTIDMPVTTALRRGGTHASMVRAYGNTVKGFDFVIDNEREGRYPGGAERATDRRRLIAGSVRSFMLGSRGCGNLGAAWHMYRRVLGWNAQLGQWKFVAGYFPWLAREKFVRGRGT